MKGNEHIWKKTMNTLKKQWKVMNISGKRQKRNDNTSKK